MPQIFDTVRLHMYFEDENGNPIPVTDMKLNFYDSKRVLLQPQVDITEENQISNGHFIYDYSIPDGTGNITVEFKGMYNNKLYLHREDIKRTWTKTAGGATYGL